MAEHVFFPPQNVEGTFLNNDVQTELQSGGRSFSDQKNVLDDRRESTNLKSDIVSHRLYENLVDAHVSCICVGLPADYIKAVEAQVANKQSVAMKYLILGRNAASQPNCSNEINEFMESYLVLLHSFKNQLEDHYGVPASEAMAAYCELEMAFQELTGMSSSQAMGTAMVYSQFEDADFESGKEDADTNMLIEGESSLVDHVREELKTELKEGYLESITGIREEILRKRKVGKLLGDTSILKQWWNSHSRWPYPTDEEKKEMVKLSGLELRQINNWFINHRKRNWNSRSSIAADPSARKTKQFP